MNRQGKNVSGTQALFQEMEQKQLILYDHPHNVAARRSKAHLKTLEEVHKTPSAPLEKTSQEFNNLVDDLVSFVTTGKGPSDLLDAALKKDKSFYTKLARDITKSGRLQDHSSSLTPLEYSLKNFYIFPHVFKYLLGNGADYSHNPTDQKTLPNILRSDQDILLDASPLLFEAGYFVTTSDMLKTIYDARSIRIAFREKFDKMIWERLPSEFASMNEQIFIQACLNNNLKQVEYCHQKGISIDFISDQKNLLLKHAGGFGLLELLKYLLHHGKYSPSQIKNLFLIAVNCDQVQIVDYLFNYCQFKKIPINQFLLQVEDELKKIDNSAATYYRYLNSDLRVSGKISEEELAVFQKKQLKKMDTVLETAIKYFKKEDFFINRNKVDGMKLMQLALTCNPVSEEKTEISAPILRLTAISHLPIIDPFAVEYAMYQAEYSVQKNTKSIELLDSLANFYHQYVKNTAHIEISVRESLDYLLSWPTRHYRPDSLLATQEASEAYSTLHTLLPTALYQLIIGYIVLQTERTPALIHMWRALKSKEKCLHCDTVLLSTPQEITLLGNKDKEVNPKSSSARAPVFSFAK